MLAKKSRLDIRLVEAGLVSSRSKAQALILAGAVLVNHAVALKSNFSVFPTDILEIKAKERFVSRGGIKLDGALMDLGIDVSGKEILDVGASTGGFTDCLLQHGAARVTAVDVGYGQIAKLLRDDPRVTLMERVNARYLKPADFPRPFDMATIDVSFISLDKILPAVAPLLKSGGEILALIKPQFEAGREEVKKGVVKDPKVHEAVISKVRLCAESMGWKGISIMPSRLKGPKGNIEFFLHGKHS